MSRSVWKGPFVDSYVLKKAEKSRESGRNEVIKIWSRRSTILPQFVGLTFGHWVEQAFASTDIVAAYLVVTGLILVATRWAPAGEGGAKH